MIEPRSFWASLLETEVCEARNSQWARIEEVDRTVLQIDGGVELMILPSHTIEVDGVVIDLSAMKRLLARMASWTRVVAVETTRDELEARSRSSTYWAI